MPELGNFGLPLTRVYIPIDWVGKRVKIVLMEAADVKEGTMVGIFTSGL
jgi:hypothetical protein